MHPSLPRSRWSTRHLRIHCIRFSQLQTSRYLHTNLALASQPYTRPRPGTRISRFANLPRPRNMPLPPELEKQYMSSTNNPSKAIAEPRPSASILLISPDNQILLLHRVRTSSSFPSAHVFPGGNISPSDGLIPAPGSAHRHADGRAYRIGAIRECFEESGILLARTGDGGRLLDVGEKEREWARKAVHGGVVEFEEWVRGLGGIADVENLYPFTRWITPTNLPKRFTTQMYIYFLPLSQPSLPSSAAIPPPTSDGGLEHTAALFASCSAWLAQARANSIILFPPQYYLLHLLSPFLSPHTSPSTPSSPTRTYTHTELQAQRDAVLQFLQGDGGDGKGIRWGDKVMSPMGLLTRKSDGRSVLALDKPGPELKGSGRGGDGDRVVLVKFGKEGPRDVEVRGRVEVLEEEKRGTKL
ncbi:hypothetical protein JHW43_000401 [Diplocarpon mali]|nr:hypothetical protein JHW43_000401 [Diplocarpon mali]